MWNRAKCDGRRNTSCVLPSLPCGSSSWTCNSLCGNTVQFGEWDRGREDLEFALRRMRAASLFACPLVSPPLRRGPSPTSTSRPLPGAASPLPFSPPAGCWPSKPPVCGRRGRTEGEVLSPLSLEWRQRDLTDRFTAVGWEVDVLDILD
jgi:hypothetical protein